MSSKNLLKLKDERIIDNNEKWFKFYLIFPLISAVISAVTCFILGIVFVDWAGPIFLLVFWGGGAVYCLIQYAFFKAILSYFILHVYYLKKISLNGDEKKEIKMKRTGNGNVNKNNCESCGEREAKDFDVEATEEETLKYDYTYRKAIALVNGNSSYDIRTGIALFEGIADWKDSIQLREKAKQKLILVVQNEQEEQKIQAKQKKRKMLVSALAWTLSIIAIIAVAIFLTI